MAFGSTKIADCLTITKHFERSCVFSNTKEATTALFTPMLTASRTQSASFSKQLENDPTAVLKKSEKTDSANPDLQDQGIIPPLANLNNLNNADDSDDPILTKMRKHFYPGASGGEVEGNGKWIDAEAAGNLFNSKCIPCGERLNMLGELDFERMYGDAKAYFQYWKEWLQAHLSNIANMASSLFGGSPYVDLCAFINWLKNFVCVPDIARILSVLMALVGFINFDINIVFDLILSLAAPLLQPILSNFVALLQQYILLIIRPIECIIQSLQNILSKLDYNVLFKNIEDLNRNVSFGRQSGEKIGTTGQNLTKAKEILGSVPPIGVPLRMAPPIQVDLHSGPRQYDVDFNLLEPAATAIQAKNQEDQRNVDKAASELRALESAAFNINAADRAAVARYDAQIKAARQKYRDAQEERDLTEIGELNKALGSSLQGIRSFMQMIVGYLRKGAELVEAFFKSIFDELKKIMGEFFGGGGTMIQLLVEKTAILSLVSIVTQLLELLTGNLDCDEEEERKNSMRGFVNQQMDMKIWQDDEGGFHIETDPEVIEKSVDRTVEAVGVDPTSLSGSPSQKLDSLIEFTGNPVIDTQIARTTEALTKPVNLVMKCPLQTTVGDAEQVNEWIKELQTEE